MGLTGYTTKTKENLLLDSGAYYKNYIVGTDTPSTAKEKLIGSTQEGGSFTAKATYRAVPVDGVHADIRGMEFIDRWDVNMTTNIIEVTPETLKLALGSADINTGDAKHDIIKGRMDVVDADYLENITFVGRLSGSKEPVIIQVYNALCVDGLVLDGKDNNNAKVSMNFKGHVDEDTLDEPPYAIYYPKRQV